MSESLNNVIFTCPECSAKSINFQGDLRSLVGKYIKKSFDTSSDRVSKEHMWVKIEELVSLDEEEYLLGRLNNDPLYCDGLDCGDTVEVRRYEIEDIFEPETVHE